MEEFNYKLIYKNLNTLLNDYSILKGLTQLRDWVEGKLSEGSNDIPRFVIGDWSTVLGFLDSIIDRGSYSENERFSLNLLREIYIEENSKTKNKVK
mgnify:CR=1 FL=1